LENFLKILEDLNLEVLIFPLMILGGILGAMFLIYLVQKKLFNKEKTRIKRISKKQCPYCGVGISENDLYCYNCGEVQYTKCVQCGKFTKKDGLYCTNCGNKEFKN
jgi:RNA polymerase subunit RPABC4/transcription elongation factor Spt4